MNPPTSRNDDRLDSVHRRAFAVTEYKEDVFVIRWDVKNFKERLNKKDPKKAILWSPLFTFEEENENKHQLVVNDNKCLQGAEQATKKLKLDPLPKLNWQLRLKWSCTERSDNSTEEVTFLSAFLFRRNIKENEAINATYHIVLLDSEEKSWMDESADSEFEKSSPGWGWPKYVSTRDLLDPKNKLLVDDTIKLQCRVIVKRHLERQLSPLNVGTCGHALLQKGSMISNISSMFTSSICTDVLIKTKGSTFKAHKGVLSCRSPVFLAMFQSEMAESIQNVVKIPDFDDDIVKWMLEHIYGIEIPREVLTENALELFQIADKYQIQGLKDLVEEVLSLNLTVQTVVDTLILADMNSVLNLKARAIKFVNMDKEAVMASDEFQKLLNYNHNPSIFKELFTDK